jgi:hypothetical protein
MNSERDKKGKFVKGITPWCKGTKGVCKPNKTSFKKGQVPWNVGISPSKKTIEKFIKSRTGIPATYKNNSKIEKMSKILKDKKPSKKEQFLIELIKEYNLPFKYVGNGKYWITGKKGKDGNDDIFNPDFISYNKDKIIEIYSGWHKSLESNRNRDIKREIVYKEKGYKFLIFWENELVNENKIKIIKRIKEIL